MSCIAQAWIEAFPQTLLSCEVAAVIWAGSTWFCMSHRELPSVMETAAGLIQTVSLPQHLTAPASPKYEHIQPGTFPNPIRSIPKVSQAHIHTSQLCKLFWNLPSPFSAQSKLLKFLYPLLEVTIQEQCKNIFKSDRNPVQINSINSSE